LLQFSGELGNELWPSVRDDIARETMEFPYISEEELCCFLGCNGCVSGNEVCSFPYGVHHYHDHIVSVSFWEFYYDVDQKCLPSFVQDLEGLEFTKGPMSLCLGPKAEITGAAILTYVLQHLWPPVGLGDEFECLPPSQVSGDEESWC
jgi:hypothetical protein